MSTDLSRAVRRLTYPRSHRSQLWACVYCGAFDRDDVTESDDAEQAFGAD
jgi:hypothetical protein